MKSLRKKPYSRSKYIQTKKNNKSFTSKPSLSKCPFKALLSTYLNN